MSTDLIGYVYSVVIIVGGVMGFVTKGRYPRKLFLTVIIYIFEEVEALMIVIRAFMED